MGISKKTKIIEEGVQYDCDLLFKEVAEAEVHCTIKVAGLPTIVISKEAFNMLPPWFRDSEEKLTNLYRRCGRRTDGFHPANLKEGVWVWTDDALHRSSSYDERFRENNKFQNVDEAMEWLNYSTPKYAYIFNDGSMVKSLVKKIVYDELPLPPNEVAIEE